MEFIKPDNMPNEAFEVWERVYQRNKDKGIDTASRFAWDAVKKGWEEKDNKWVKKASDIRHSFRGSVTDLETIQSPSDSNTSTIEILRTGTWSHPFYGEIEITNERLSRFKANFDSRVRKTDLPIDREHHSDDGAVGWIKEVFHEVTSDGVGILKARVEWTEEGAADVKAKKYRYFSPEFSDEYEVASSGEIFQDVLIGGAITNRPFFEELEEVVLSDTQPFLQFSMTKVLKGGEKTMAKLTVDQLKAKLKEDPNFKPTEEEASAEELKAAQEAIVAEKAAEEGNEGEGEGEGGDEADNQDGAGKNEPVKGSDKGKGKTFSISEAEYKALKFAAESGAKAHKELRKSQIYSEVDGLTFNSKTKEGVLLPKDADKVKQFALTLGDNQRKMFFDILRNLPKADKLFSEVGKDTAEGENFDGNLSTDEELAKRAQKLMSEKPEQYKSFRDAAYEVERQMKAEGKKL